MTVPAATPAAAGGAGGPDAHRRRRQLGARPRAVRRHQLDRVLDDAGDLVRPLGLLERGRRPLRLSGPDQLARESRRPLDMVVAEVREAIVLRVGRRGGHQPVQPRLQLRIRHCLSIAHLVYWVHAN